MWAWCSCCGTAVHLPDDGAVKTRMVLAGVLMGFWAPGTAAARGRGGVFGRARRPATALLGRPPKFGGVKVPESRGRRDAKKGGPPQSRALASVKLPLREVVVFDFAESFLR